MPSCGCGCGGEVKEGRRFIRWHNSRSPEHKNRLRERNKKYNASPEGKAQIEKLHREWNSSPEGKANAKKMGEKWHNSPEGKAHLERWNNSPENISQLLNAPCPRIAYGECGIINHKHRSKLESKYCKETDFVISQSKDIKTWLKVIEIHDSYWDVLNDIDDYAQTRTEELRTAGVTCPIEIIIQRHSNRTINRSGVSS